MMFEMVLLAACTGLGAGMDPFVPFNYRTLGVAATCDEIRSIHARTGLRRFFICGPCFNDVMYGPFPDTLYAEMGKDVGAIREKLSGTGVEISWWCAPSIRYYSDFPPIEDAAGHKSQDNKKCPLDEAFAADFAAKVKAVAMGRPRFICIEDDYTLGWGRGLDRVGACFCRRHLADFAKRFGKPLDGPQIAAAFAKPTEGNLAIRRAFGDTIRGSLVSLARKVRAAIDEVDPTIRVLLCEPGMNADKDGVALVDVARAFAGGTRPAIRPSGAIYGAETTPASIPRALAHTMWTLEHAPADIEKFYEADVYPHNRFYSSASQLMSLMGGTVMMGTDDFLFYCLQYLDDPLEDPGYAMAFTAFRPRFEAARDFIRRHRSRLAGVRIVWDPQCVALTRGMGANADQLLCGSYLLAKFGIPYTTGSDAGGVALLVGGLANLLSNAELRELLSHGLIVDAPAAAILARRGFARELGVDVTLAKGRLPVVDEAILPAAGCTRKGRHTNAFYIFSAGTEGTVRQFATLKPHPGTEVWSEFYGTNGTVVTPSLTLSGNALGGKVAVFAVSLIGNRSSGLMNLRKQELLGNLLERLSPNAIPVSARDAPGIWTLASVAADGRAMLVSVNNLSGDVRDDVVLALSQEWAGADAFRLSEEGSCKAVGRAAAKWRVPVALAQMSPEFFVLKKCEGTAKGKDVRP